MQVADTHYRLQPPLDFLLSPAPDYLNLVRSVSLAVVARRSSGRITLGFPSCAPNAADTAFHDPA